MVVVAATDAAVVMATIGREREREKERENYLVRGGRYESGNKNLNNKKKNRLRPSEMTFWTYLVGLKSL